MSLRTLPIIVVMFAATMGLCTAEETKAETKKPYPLDTCLIMGDKVDDASVTEVYKGQEFRFCCKGCIKKFKKDPDKYVKMLEEEVAKKKDAAK